MVDLNLKVILQQLEAEKSVDRTTLIEAIRNAIESAARKSSILDAEDIVVEVDEDTIEFRVFEIRRVVEHVEDRTTEISLKDAQKLVPQAQVGNRLKVQAEPREFGRIAAQTAKQVIIQKIKDAERDNIYDEFKTREGEVVSGVVKRMAQGNVIVIVDKAEAIIPPKEQSPREHLRPGDRIRAYLVSVDKTPRGAQVILSRATPELVRTLFELEVPEIFDGTIEIKAIAREAGSRTKIAVRSKDPNVDPVGACVGMKGSRVRSVVEELSGEKIDIVRWSDNIAELCAQALNPADILEMTLDEENQTVQVIVPNDQLSLAIGKRGQNARLASRLIGWSIDIQGAGGETEDSDESGTATESAEAGETSADTDGVTPEPPDASPEAGEGVSVAKEED